MDDLNRQILIQLQEDGRRSYREIGARLGVSAGTVRSRAQQLMANGLLEVIAVPNPWRMGFKFLVLVGLRVQPGRAVDVAMSLTSRQEVSWVGLTATGFDVMFEVALEDEQAFGRYREEVLAALPGYVSSEAFLIWEVRKLRYLLQSVEGEGSASNGPTPRGSWAELTIKPPAADVSPSPRPTRRPRARAPRARS